MSQKPVVVPIERYAVLIGAYGSRDPGRAPSQNIQIFHWPPDHDLRTRSSCKVDAPPTLGWKATNALTVFLPPDAFADV
jgi:hypothetical protein